jgi:hypothetical protein
MNFTVRLADRQPARPAPRPLPDLRVVLWPLVPCDVPRVPPLRRRLRKLAARRQFIESLENPAHRKAVARAMSEPARPRGGQP